MNNNFTKSNGPFGIYGTTYDKANVKSCFQKRLGKIDWKKIAAIDIDHLAREVDFRVLQENIDNIVFCNIENEVDTSKVDPLFVKLFKLGQLTMEYLLHSQDHFVNIIEKMQEKIDKTERELAKEKQEHKKENELFTESQHKNKNKRALDKHMMENVESYNSCSYCSKIFFSAKYLVSHILRRHPDEALAFHKAFSNLKTKPDYEVSRNEKNITDVLEREIKDLKQTFDQTKRDIEEHIQSAVHNICNAGNKNISYNDLNIKKYIDEWKEEEKFRQKKEIEKIEQGFISELQELKLKCLNSEDIIHNLEQKYNSLLESSKQNISLNNQINAENEAKDQNITKEVLKEQNKGFASIKAELEQHLIASQNAIYKQLQEHDIEWKSKIIELKEQHTIELEKLHSLLESSLSKLNSEQKIQNIEKKFEQHLQLLTRKPQKKIRKRHDESSDRKVRHSLSQSHEEKIIHNPPNPIAYPSAPITEPVEIPRKTEENNELHNVTRVKTALENAPNLLEGLYSELIGLVEDKMESYGVRPLVLKLESSDFDDKMKFLNNENQQLEAKYPNFFTIRNYYDDLTNKKAQLLMQRGGSAKRITFAIPEVTEQIETIPFVEQKPMAGTKRFTPSVQENATKYDNHNLVISELKLLQKTSKYNDKLNNFGFETSIKVPTTQIQTEPYHAVDHSTDFENHSAQLQTVNLPSKPPKPAPRQLVFQESTKDTVAIVKQKSKSGVNTKLDSKMMKPNSDLKSVADNEISSKSSLESLSSWDSDELSIETIK